LTKKCGCEGVGTVEKRRFLFPRKEYLSSGEHTVIEEPMGIDLVKWQLMVANGEEMTLRQKDTV